MDPLGQGEEGHCRVEWRRLPDLHGVMAAVAKPAGTMEACGAESLWSCNRIGLYLEHALSWGSEGMPQVASPQRAIANMARFSQFVNVMLNLHGDIDVVCFTSPHFVIPSEAGDQTLISPDQRL